MCRFKSSTAVREAPPRITLLPGYDAKATECGYLYMKFSFRKVKKKIP